MEEKVPSHVLAQERLQAAYIEKMYIGSGWARIITAGCMPRAEEMRERKGHTANGSSGRLRLRRARPKPKPTHRQEHLGRHRFAFGGGLPCHGKTPAP